MANWASPCHSPGALEELEKIPEPVLVIAPNLANPMCRLSVDFSSKNPLPESDLVAPQFPPRDSQASPPAKAANLPSDIAQSLTAFAAYAKKNGLGPIDPVLDAYDRLRIANDDEDATALLDKMTPSQAAMAAYSRHDYLLAIKLWTPLAERGDAQAAASIGSLFEYGLNGVTQDYVQAAKWRKLASSEGDSNSQAALGEDYAEGQGVPKDTDWATWLGESGSPDDARAYLKTVEGVKWAITKEERAATTKRGKPSTSDPGGRQ